MTNTTSTTIGLRTIAFGAAFCLALSAKSQTAPAAPAAPAPDQSSDILMMSQFEVNTTQGHGYFAPTTAAAFKTNESMMNVPQGVIVVTKDFIDDINTSDSSQVLRFFGVAAKFTGDTMLLRGSAVQAQPVRRRYTDAPVLLRHLDL